MSPRLVQQHGRAVGAGDAIAGARERGGHLRIAAAAPVVVGTIDLLNLREYLSLFDSEAEAVRRAA